VSQDLHCSVLLHESVQALVQDPAGIYIDGTFGRGGHTRAMLQQLGPQGRVLAFDKDPEAIAYGQAQFAAEPRLQLIHSSFADIETVLAGLGLAGAISGVLLDLGVSSPQLDQAERGFSFMHDGPLDMRMDTTAGPSAAEWINSAQEGQLMHTFFDFGEERFARRIARAIVARREKKPFERTKDLAEVVAAANPKWEREKHPATRVFQAIRIFINKELDDLQQGLQAAFDVLKPGGRVAVISFHSLEDRIVKRFFKEGVKGEEFPKGLPIRADQINRTMDLVTKPIKAGSEELKNNVRARSAVLRVAEKLAGSQTQETINKNKY
jgi:16S rRNA (cytosine1402-N4)-methyltransferase